MSGIVAHDLRQWLPGYGENSLAIFFDGSKLTVEVKFDGKEMQEDVISLTFQGVSFFAVGSMPGVPSVDTGSYEADYHTGCVIEAENSALSTKWVEHWSKTGLKRRCCHFVMFWGAENKVIHVIAESSELC